MQRATELLKELGIHYETQVVSAHRTPQRLYDFARNGMDSLLSIAQMPAGVAVATQAIGSAGAFNAGLMAAQILSLEDKELQQLTHWRQTLTDNVPSEVESCT